MILTEEQFQKYRKVIHWVSPSRIKGKKVKSPKHYKWLKEHPEPDTPAKDMGKAFHMYLMQEELFHKEHIAATWADFGSDPKRNKDGAINLQDKFNKDVRDKLIANNPGKKLLMPDVMEDLIEERKAIRSLPNFDLEYDFVNGFVETTFLAFAKFDDKNIFQEIVDMDPEVYLALTDKEKWNYIPILCRIDYGSKVKSFLADFKTADDITPNGFSKAMEEQGYHLQAAMELDIVNAIIGPDEQGQLYDTFYFVCVENHPPYDAIYFRPPLSCIMSGRTEYITKLHWIKNALASGIWEGVSILAEDPQNGYYKDLGSNTIEMDLPQWYYKKHPLV
jgi:hypothetical protein